MDADLGDAGLVAELNDLLRLDHDVVEAVQRGVARAVDSLRPGRDR